tara:strand:+ start:2318 stop:2647 length:330 start_codon:yes stop_codon:yes gene_type:complete
MAKFFQSETVRDEMEDIYDMQKELMDVIAKFPYMSDEAKFIHIETVKELLEKQQIMWTRVSLSDDPEAKKMKESIRKGSKEMGFGDADINMIFKNMRYTLDAVQQSLRR